MAKLTTIYSEDSPDQWFSNSSLSPTFYLNQKKKTYLIHTEILDRYLNNTLDLLKIDTEGWESKILLKSQNLNFVKKIIVEFHPIKTNNFAILINHLKKYFTLFFYQENKQKSINNLILTKLLIIEGWKK